MNEIQLKQLESKLEGLKWNLIKLVRLLLDGSPEQDFNSELEKLLIRLADKT